MNFFKSTRKSGDDSGSSFVHESGALEQVTAVVCCILALVPVFGIFAAALASFITWKCRDWTRMASFIAVMIAILVTIFYYVV